MKVSKKEIECTKYKIALSEREVDDLVQILSLIGGKSSLRETASELYDALNRATDGKIKFDSEFYFPFQSKKTIGDTVGIRRISEGKLCF